MSAIYRDTLDNYGYVRYLKFPREDPGLVRLTGELVCEVCPPATTISRGGSQGCDGSARAPHAAALGRGFAALVTAVAAVAAWLLISIALLGEPPA